MRSLSKGPTPKILSDNQATWTAAYVADKTNDTKKFRYRHEDIKSALKEETGFKCVYCESKIGHNTPGDVEHKIPSSADETKHFEWSNLTVACTECNRRKRAYYDMVKPFLDPYVPGIEDRLVHQGPVVSWKPGDVVAEVSVKILELNSDARAQLISQKVEKIDSLNNVVARLHDADPLLRDLMRLKVQEMSEPTAEFSGMVVELCKQYGI